MVQKLYDLFFICWLFFCFVFCNGFGQQLALFVDLFEFTRRLANFNGYFTHPSLLVLDTVIFNSRLFNSFILAADNIQNCLHLFCYSRFNSNLKSIHQILAMLCRWKQKKKPANAGKKNPVEFRKEKYSTKNVSIFDRNWYWHKQISTHFAWQTGSFF